MGRCVKIVNIDHEAHLGFLLQRLNNRYGNRGASSEAFNNNKKKSSGPLQLNIPLFSMTRESVSRPIVSSQKDAMALPQKNSEEKKVEEKVIFY